MFRTVAIRSLGKARLFPGSHPDLAVLRLGRPSAALSRPAKVQRPPLATGPEIGHNLFQSGGTWLRVVGCMQPAPSRRGIWPSRSRETRFESTTSLARSAAVPLVLLPGVGLCTGCPSNGPEPGIGPLSKAAVEMMVMRLPGTSAQGQSAMSIPDAELVVAPRLRTQIVRCSPGWLVL